MELLYGVCKVCTDNTFMGSGATRGASARVRGKHGAINLKFFPLFQIVFQDFTELSQKLHLVIFPRFPIWHNFSLNFCDVKISLEFFQSFLKIIW